MVAMPHIHVEHFVMSIRPNNGNISLADDVFFAKGIVGRIEGDQNLNVFGQPRIW